MGRRWTVALAIAALLLCSAAVAAQHASGSDAALTMADAAQEGVQAADADDTADAQRLAEKRADDSDDSVRCRLSGICEGPSPECALPAAAKDPLACLTSDADRAAAVQQAALHAWGGYRDCAWGEDELAPLHCSGSHWLNLSLTMVDSLDTLYLLGLHREFEEASLWLAEHLDVGAPSEVNLFETTIRILGGLLGAQALSASTHPALSRVLAEKAAELGARLMPAFDSPSGVPYSDVSLLSGKGSMPAWGQISSLSEISTVSLEFTYLARITGHAPFELTPLAVHERLSGAHAAGGGLLGQFFSPLTGKAHKAQGQTITLGARSDSYYEYLLKQWVLTGKKDGWLRERYVKAMHSVRSRLLRRTAPVGRPGLWYVSEQARGGKLSSKFDHLVCFLPGLLALGDFHGVSTQLSATPAAAEAAAVAATEAAAGSEAHEAAGRRPHQRRPPRQAADGAHVEAAPGAGGDATAAAGEGMPDLALAAELALTCYELYRRTPAGLAPEIAHFANNTEADFPNKHVHDVGQGDFAIKPKDAHNLLRPEALESFFLLWKTTGDPRYKQWAWQVFRALEKWARVRPQDRQRHCATCLAQQAYEAAEAAKAAAGGGGGDAASAAAVAGRQQLEEGGGSKCSSCSTSGGYTSLESVLEVPPPRRDKMESFFVAETLKYLHLTFAEPPDRCLHPSCAAGTAGAAAQLPLDGFVFTTEAHALPVVGPAAQSRVTPLYDLPRHLLFPFEAAAAATGGGSKDSGGGTEQQAKQQQQQPEGREMREGEAAGQATADAAASARETAAEL